VKRALGVLVMASAFAGLAHSATSVQQAHAYLAPICAVNVTGEGFDPWTGLPHGRSYLCDPTHFGPGPEAPHFVQEDVPIDMSLRRALPLGFLLGLTLSLGGLFLGRRFGSHPWRGALALLIGGLVVVTAVGLMQPRIKMGLSCGPPPTDPVAYAEWSKECRA
jgi:hypothetical protein